VVSLHRLEAKHARDADALRIFRIGLRLDEDYFARVGGGRMLRRDRTTGDMLADSTSRATLEAFG
jgi:hypothetical protein